MEDVPNETSDRNFSYFLSFLSLIISCLAICWLKHHLDKNKNTKNVNYQKFMKWAPYIVTIVIFALNWVLSKILWELTLWE